MSSTRPMSSSTSNSNSNSNSNTTGNNMNSNPSQQQQHQSNAQSQSLSSANGNKDVVEQANKTVDILYEMSTLLHTGLDKKSLQLCMELCEMGVNAEALAHVVKEIQREAKNI